MTSTRNASRNAARIFISHRRQDSEAAASRLAEDLRRHFADEQVFQDFSSIDPGADFVEAVQRGLDTCAAVVVVIGPDWLKVVDRSGRRRIDLPEDWVRHEVGESLRRPGVRVFPVLVGGADMPGVADLPVELQPLTRRQAFPLTVRHWPKDVAELAEHLRRVPGLDRPQRVTGLVDWLRKIGAGKGWRWSGVAVAVLAALGYWWSSSRDPAGPRVTKLADPPVVKPTDPPTARPAVAAPRTEPDLHPEAETTETARPARKAGEVFRDCSDCPEMVVIPAGRFLMGSPKGESGRSNDEGPQHEVAMAQPFAVGKYEVSFAEWDACVAAGGCRHRPDDAGWGRSRRPVVNVSWEDARTYVAWLAKKTGKGYRMLSEAEWEYAARAGTTSSYPWGNEAGQGRANFQGSGSQWSGKQTAPVGSFAPNRFGLYDMIGNAWEWTQDCWNESYSGAPAEGSPWLKGDCGRRVVRGGSWNLQPEDARAAFRSWVVPGDRDIILGFRLARKF
ncbi:MAG: SUMF1/EgtB/PvdO family nonheme iron enzyme [Candidatus Accumulibacter sp.]|uniref:SUMF1/EgtB/PvdO family nonheme iron enzyme n=1 Tax=Accumulibacter sp. TaxID=2053492 RepID=UPI001AC4C8A8|nr:SUMF1/EgtB/PvdO family nonheme iron enzyme [Accumulibacter sp.]MBN8518420.1 SUMF1/EgtB/PvdO family nonheme iron enzyme [Accumulibacter sp.]